MDPESAKSCVLEKLKELWMLLTSFAAYVSRVFDEKFPPETRDEKIHGWLKASTPWLIAGSAVLLLSCCCRRRRGGRMMKAPGQDFRMLRDDFERSPRSYFGDLRAKKKKRSQLLG
uniref:Uncharacterized protein n=1 Tax=Kalanchoe fedtschenkoi TaxID=63787 RepID=A0A7N0VHS5_KALFE